MKIRVQFSNPHFEQSSQLLNSDLCDAATDSSAFIDRSLKAMNEEEGGCEDAIKAQAPVKFVGHTSNLARLANR